MASKSPHPLIEARRSTVHGRGVFALASIPKGKRIVEYQGERISKKEAEKRSHQRKGPIWIFELNQKWDVDGLRHGNIARFINHSCEPNCEVINTTRQLWVIAKRRIEPGEELFYNYGFDIENYQDHPCYCNTKRCVGYILEEGVRKKYQKLPKAKRAQK